MRGIRYANYATMMSGVNENQNQPVSTTVQTADLKSFVQASLAGDSSEYVYDTEKQTTLEKAFGSALKGVRIDRLVGNSGNLYNNAVILVEVKGFGGRTFQKSVPVRLWKGRDSDALPDRVYTADEAKAIKASFAFNAKGYRSDDGTNPVLYLNMLPEGVDPNAQ